MNQVPYLATINNHRASIIKDALMLLRSILCDLLSVKHSVRGIE